ncbi:MAG: FkbM family methyltransferase [Ilumatobacteraceae bacterium]
MLSDRWSDAKRRLIGNRFEPALRKARWMANLPKVLRDPEVMPLTLEDGYMTLATEHLVTPGTLCVDGGSHIGSKLVEFIRLAPGVEHLAFEPVPSKAEWLRKRFGSQAEIHEQALGAEAGVATLSEPQSIGSGYSSLRTIHEDDCLTYEVEVTTLDKEVGDREVGFIKLDLEGYELFALQGARETLQRCRPALQFECSLPDTLAGIGYDRSEIFDFLHELDYDVYLAVDFVFGRSPMCGSEFARAGQFPFPGLNYFAVPTGTEVRRLR